jgi:hypothetical protein
MDATYYVGLDLGQSADYTALAVVQKVPVYDAETGKHSKELHLKHLERYPLKTPYTDIADQVNLKDALHRYRGSGEEPTQWPAFHHARSPKWSSGQTHHRANRG